VFAKANLEHIAVVFRQNVKPQCLLSNILVVRSNRLDWPLGRINWLIFCRPGGDHFSRIPYWYDCPVSWLVHRSCDVLLRALHGEQSTAAPWPSGRLRLAVFSAWRLPARAGCTSDLFKNTGSPLLTFFTN